MAEQHGAHVHGGITMHGDHDHHDHKVDQPHHPTWKFYVLVGVILTVVTLVEVGIFYIPQMKPILIPTLAVLSLAKFMTVVLFYMHLKFDSPIFRRVFFAPLFLAVLVVTGLVILFKVLPAYDLWR
jgi:cytochrome c oxidase subunit IV